MKERPREIEAKLERALELVEKMNLAEQGDELRAMEERGEPVALVHHFWSTARHELARRNVEAWRDVARELINARLAVVRRAIEDNP